MDHAITIKTPKTITIVEISNNIDNITIIHEITTNFHEIIKILEITTISKIKATIDNAEINKTTTVDKIKLNLIMFHNITTINTKDQHRWF